KSHPKSSKSISLFGLDRRTTSRHIQFFYLIHTLILHICHCWYPPYREYKYMARGPLESLMIFIIPCSSVSFLKIFLAEYDNNPHKPWLASYSTTCAFSN